MSYEEKLQVLADIDRICVNARIFLDLVESRQSYGWEETYRDCFRQEMKELSGKIFLLSNDAEICRKDAGLC